MPADERRAGLASGVVASGLPLAAALVAWSAVWASVLNAILRSTEGRISYVLDDAFIHMAISRNLAESGTWGVTQGSFSGASSSPLWTLVLGAVYRVLGVSDVAPLVLTSFLSVLLLVAVDVLLLRHRVGARLRAIGLLWVVFGTPLAPVVFGGMEHPLQILINVLVLVLVAEAVRSEGRLGPSLLVGLSTLALLATGVRYEGLAVGAAVSALLWFRRRRVEAAVVMVSGAVPVIAYGLYSLANGGYFLPNPIIIKGGTSSGLTLAGGDPIQMVKYVVVGLWAGGPVSGFLLVSLILLGFRTWGSRVDLSSPRIALPVLVALVTIAHLMFGGIGWFYRYESYLYVLLGCALILQVSDRELSARIRMRTSRQWVVALGLGVVGVLMAAMVVASAGRGWRALQETPIAAENIYQQQVQMGRCLAKTGFTRIALNDLGAVAFYARPSTISDLVGLGTRRPVSGLLADRIPDAPQIKRIASGAQVAVIYDQWYPDLPDDWTPVARWTISDNVVCAFDTVTFYAIAPTDPGQLSRSLDAYAASELPSSVRHVSISP